MDREADNRTHCIVGAWADLVFLVPTRAQQALAAFAEFEQARKLEQHCSNLAVSVHSRDKRKDRDDEQHKRAHLHTDETKTRAIWSEKPTFTWQSR